MKCEELLRAMNEYVDGQLDPGICAEFEQHLAGCNPCQVVVDNIRKTITLYRLDRPHEIPRQLHDRLRQALQERWKARHGDGPADTPRSV